jgi:ABC-type multidrug transport system ATPase subunit
MGPNGSGKTTTLSMVAGALRPTSGRVLVCGYDVWGSGWYEARSRIGYAPQNMPFVERLTVLENMVWHGMLRGLSIGEARRRGLRLLEEVGLSEARGKMVRQLSGGMRRRLAVAAALIGDPEVLVLDEPGSGLDPAARDAVWSMISRLASSRAVLVSTHSALEAEHYADKVLVMHSGRIVAQGAPGELVRRYAPPPRVVLEGSIPRAAVEAASRLGEVVEASPARLMVAVRDPEEALPALVEAAASAGGRVRRAFAEKPGLRDVYLALTGEPMEA